MTTRRRIERGGLLLGAALVVAVMPVLGPTSVAATSTRATANLDAGSMALVNVPTALDFEKVQGASNLAFQSGESFDISDATATGSGWSLAATSTTFTGGGIALPTSATTVEDAPTVQCDPDSTCSPASDDLIVYPYILPAGATEPTATKLFGAAPFTGIGSQTVTPEFSLDVPAGASSASYSSTWMFSLDTGP